VAQTTSKQTARQREAARRAQQARAEAAAAAQAARRARQIRFGAIAGLLTLVVLGALFWNSWRHNQPAPPPAASATAVLTTTVGDITIELYGNEAPIAVENFVNLANDGFFDDTTCHRLTTAGIFVLQCGDPEGTGMGGPENRFGPVENAPADNNYPAGTLAMARVGGDAYSMGSQFFLVYEDSFIPSDAAGGYTVFGRITSGLDLVRAVADAGVVGGASDGRPVTDVTIEGVSVQWTTP